MLDTRKSCFAGAVKTLPQLKYQLKISLILAVLIATAGCKNQETKDPYEDNGSSITTDGETTNSALFDLLVTKKTGPWDFPDSLVTRFDPSNSLTNKELIDLGITNLPTDENTYYFPVEESFLKENLDSIDVLLYYRHDYGDQTEKLLRVKRKDTIFDITLAMDGGDGQDSYSVSSEFLDRYTFIKTLLIEKTVKDNMHSTAYAIDSIIIEYQYNDVFDFRETARDTFHVYKENPIYHSDLKGSTFKLWGRDFTINGLPCKWEYEVRYSWNTDHESEKLMLDMLNQKLVDKKSQKTVLTVDPKELGRDAQDIIVLDGQMNECPVSDINFDGYSDLQVVTERNTSGNQSILVYLFNPDKKNFELSNELSGNSLNSDGIELDTEKRIAIYSQKGGGGHYNIKKIHFGEAGQVAFSEAFWNEITSEYVQRDGAQLNKRIFYYEKYIDDDIVENKMDTVLSGEDDFGADQFFRWAGYEGVY